MKFCHRTLITQQAMQIHCLWEEQQIGGALALGKTESPDIVGVNPHPCILCPQNLVL